MSAETQEAETEDEFVYHAQVTQHPHTIIEGDVTDIVTGADLDSNVENTGSNFGVIIKNPTVPEGTIWKNRNIPDGFESTSEYNDTLRVAIEGTDINYIRGREVTESLVEEARSAVTEEVDGEWGELSYEEEKVDGTDYKIADPTDQEASVQEIDGNTLGIDVSGGVFESEEVEELSDTIMVWYGGMSGQFLSRALDFNGLPFARYTEDGYLMKGLYQAPIGWRGDADVEQFDNVPTTDRKELAQSQKRGGLGRPPRVARPPLLRDDIDGRTAIELGRLNGGDMYEIHAIRALEDYSDYLNDESEADEIDMRYDNAPEERLAEAFDNPDEIYTLYTGEGWQDTPDNAQNVTDNSGEDGGGSFDVDVSDDDGDEVSHPTDGEVEFAQMVSEQIAGTGADPRDDIFNADGNDVNLEGLIGANSGNFEVTPDVAAITEEVFERADHLSTGDL
jgi:hypothetical protein